MGTERSKGPLENQRLLHQTLQNAGQLMITLRDDFDGLSMEWHISSFILRFTTIEASALRIHYTFYSDGRFLRQTHSDLKN